MASFFFYGVLTFYVCLYSDYSSGPRCVVDRDAHRDPLSTSYPASSRLGDHPHGRYFGRGLRGLTSAPYRP